MTLKTTVFGDPHLNSKTDFEVDLFESYLERKRTDEKMDLPDVMVLVGDVVDPIPSDRNGSSEWKNTPITEEHVELGRHLVGNLSELGEEYGFKTLSVPGNHDPDIHDRFVEGYGNVYNLHNNSIDSEDIDLPGGYSFVGRGAEQFDIGPEIDYLEYESLRSEEEFFSNANADTLDTNGSGFREASNGEPHLNALINGVHHVTKGNRTAEELAEDLGITEDEKQDFFREIDGYTEVYGEAEQLFKDIEPERTSIFVNHAAPFNTYIDERYDGERKVHDGLITDRNLYMDYEPILNLNGHHHKGHIEYHQGYGSGTTIINADKQQIVELEISDNSVAYNPLN